MSFSLSSVSVSSLSSCFSASSFHFINQDREVKYTELSSTLSGLQLKYPEFSQYITNLWFDENYYLFLTTGSLLSSYFNTFKTLSSSIYGYDMSQYNFEYDWLVNNFSVSYSCLNTTQFLGIIDNDLKINICPLKTKLSLDDSQYSLSENYKEYQKIYDNNDSLFLQFKTTKIPYQIKPDVYNLIFNSYNVASCYINDTDFIKNGAVGGNCPLNSDVIFFDQNEYGSYTNNGTQNINSVNNGTLLCLWLSSQNVSPSSNKVWVERWYDPNTVTQGQAFITQKNTVSSSFSYIKDLESTKILSEKEKLTYLRYGEKRNETFLNSISSNLVAEFKNWQKDFSSTVNNISGYIVGESYGDTNTFVLCGTNHAHIPSTEILFIDNSFSVSLWANSDDWSSNNDSQFFGNYHNNTGYGIFYNTGTPDNLISITTSSNNIFSLNNKGFKVFEKDIKQDLALSSLAIEYIKTDLFGNRWLFDKSNSALYKIENDDLLIRTIQLPASSNVVKIDCDSNNNIFVFDNFYSNISCFNSYGDYLSATSVPANTRSFCIDCSNNILSSNANFIDVNYNNQVITINGGSISLNNNKILHLPTLPNSFKIDSQNNMWFLVGNTLYKTDENGFIIFQKQLPLSFNNKNSEMCFVKSYANNYEKIYLWIVFNEQNSVLVLDENGNFFKNIDLTKLFIGNYCSTLNTNVHGDFSGFDNKRRFEIFQGKSISPSNTVLSVKLNLVCENNYKIIQLNHSTKSLKDWVHLGLTMTNTPTQTIIKFYVNGVVVDSYALQGLYKINNGYKSSPFIIGGNSGKLGAKNLEKSIIKNGYFKGQVDDLRIYNKSLNDFELFHLSLNNHFEKWKPINMYVECPETTFLEQMDTFYINRYKGFKSNYFNIKIKNFTDNQDLQNLIKDYILQNIENYIPANTILNQVKFE